jgi:DNA mismatch endonuclease (patch repair protein)
VFSGSCHRLCPTGTMADNRSPESRSALMSRIRGKDTAPELVVRRLLHAHGYRFRLHRRDLPGTPDIVFPSRRKVIFVNGCFWHAHGCRIGRPPKSRPEFWLPKLQKNRSKDARNLRALRGLGWQVLTVWQCQTKSQGRLEAKLFSFLGPPGKIPIDKPPATE